MSRIGKKPIPVPAGVTVTFQGGKIQVKGPKGELEDTINVLTQVSLDEAKKELIVTRQDDGRLARAAHGLQRSLISNMVIGVSQGYSRAMELHGTGYTIDVKGTEVAFSVGYAIPATLEIPKSLKIDVQQRAAQPNNPAKFTISGPDKQLLGQFAANVRRIKPPEPYQGKGLRYADEQVRRKEGKAVVGAG